MWAKIRAGGAGGRGGHGGPAGPAGVGGRGDDAAAIPIAAFGPEPRKRRTLNIEHRPSNTRYRARATFRVRRWTFDVGRSRFDVRPHPGGEGGQGGEPQECQVLRGGVGILGGTLDGATVDSRRWTVDGVATPPPICITLEGREVIQLGGEGHRAPRIAKAPICITPWGEGSDTVRRETPRKPPDRQSADLYQPTAEAGVIQIGGGSGALPCLPPTRSGKGRPSCPSCPSCPRLGRLTCPSETPRLGRVAVAQDPLSPSGGNTWPCLEQWARSRSWTWRRGR